MAKNCPDCSSPLRGDGSCCDFCGWTLVGGGDDPRLPSQRSREQIRAEIDRRTRDRCNKAAAKLVGRKIVDARYMTPERAAEWAWDDCPVVLILDDGSALIPSSDDEGNGAGVLFHLDKNGRQSSAGFPVLRP